MAIEDNYNSIWETVSLIVQEMFPSLLATILGGLVLAFIFFYVREKCFPLPDISGEWNVYTETTETSYDPYKDMLLTYKAVLLCEGSSITGTSEKIYEKSSTKEGNYTGKDRTRGEISGSIDKRYFSKDRVRIHIVEHGDKRDSTIYHDLKFENKSLMKGRFFTTAADSKGMVNWKRNGTCV